MKTERFVLSTVVGMTLGASLVLMGCGAAATPGAATDPATTSTITVTGTSEVRVEPDMAKFSVSVTTQADDAQATQALNAELVEVVTERLKQNGVAEKSIQTGYTYLSPRYGYEIMDDVDSAILGYDMTTQLIISDVHVDDAGTLMGEAVAAGATGVDGLQFYSSEYDAKYEEALAAAVEATRPKAETIARASGASLGGVISVVEGYQNMAVRYAADTSMAMANEEAAIEVPIEPGEVAVEASVTVVYEIH